MKLLIIGVTGQVASSLLEAKSKIIDEVVAFGLPELDISDASSIRAAFDRERPDIVVNAAAYNAVDKAEEESELALVINRNGPLMLAENCLRLDIPLIHISTDYVFDGTNSSAYVESDLVAPLGVYGRSKSEGDEAVMSTTPKHIILRTAWVYSPFGNNFVKTMLRLAQTHDELSVVDDQHGSPSYAPHIAEGIMVIIEELAHNVSPDELWGIYHMAGSGDTTWYGFASEIFARLHQFNGQSVKLSPISTAQYPTQAKRPANSRLDCSKLQATFGIRLPDWRDGTAECVKRLLEEQRS